jgi:hypothetical protein
MHAQRGLQQTLCTADVLEDNARKARLDLVERHTQRCDPPMSPESLSERRWIRGCRDAR